MNVRSLTPVIATDRLADSREFYEKHLGFQVIFENDWYIQMRSTGEPPVDVAFVKPNHESQPPIFQPAYCGKGVIYTVEVDDAKKEYGRKDAGLTIADEPWGERHFAVVDPNGIPVNISQLIGPANEYMPYFRS